MLLLVTKCQCGDVGLNLGDVATRLVYQHRAGKSPRNAISRALSLMSAAGVRPAGLVLNRLPRRRGAGYYYYYTSEGYGADGGAYRGQYGRHPAATAAASSVSGNGA